VTIRTRRGRLAQINTLRRAAYGYDQRFEVMAAKACCRRAINKRPKSSPGMRKALVVDKPEHFFLERYRAAYAAEMAHFFDALARGVPVRTSIDDGVKALALARCRDHVVARKAIVEL